jgi:gamma-butyrobetaine dioxygenase
VEVKAGDTVRRFPAIWLRDNCACSACQDPTSGQKLFGVEDLPENLSVRTVEQVDDTLTVQFGPDDHRGVYRLDWLLAESTVDSRTEDAKILWTPENRPAKVSGSWPRFVADADHRLDCLEAVLRFGLVLLHDVPVQPGAVLDVARGFSFVRETNYGRLFDVVSRPDAPNLAFTDRPITPHTDNPYRDPVPTLQLLHCLANEAEGGDTGLVDGFAVAAELRADDPAAFDTLSQTPMTFRYTEDGVDLVATAPLITVDPYGRIRAIRHNNRSAQPLRRPYEQTVAFYQAYRDFAERLNAGQWSLRLTPGDCLVFDNARILHARTGFSRHGQRHLQGCYADIDATESQWRAHRGKADHDG